MLVFLGPVVFQKKPTCDVTTCSLGGLCYNLHPAVCVCGEKHIFDETNKTCKIIDERVFKITDLHINKRYLPSYAAPTSNEFIRIARYIEDKLMTTYFTDRDVIQGVKVVAAWRGSIVLDLLLLRSNSISSLDAFDYVIQALQSPDKQSLSIKHDHFPVYHPFSEINEIKDDKSLSVSPNLLYIIVPTLIICFIVVVALLIWYGRRRNGNNKLSTYDNHAVSMDTLS